MTLDTEMGSQPRVGRKKRWYEIMGAPFPKGTFARMDAVLRKNEDGKEDRTDLVREAVEKELERREAQKRKPGRRS
jgi:hypothetical protein